LASIVKFYGGEITQESLRETSGTTSNGTSLLGLYQSAEKIGFEVKGYETTVKYLKKIKDPIILHIIKDKKLEHYVVCYGFENDKFIIGDPGWGIIRYSEDELVAVWKSKALLKLSPGKNFKTKKEIILSKQTWFLQLIKDDYPLLGIAAFLGIIISILNLATAIFTQKLIDHILPEKNQHTLILGILIFGIVVITRAFITYVRSVFLVRQGKDMNVRLISNYFDKLLFLPKSFFDSTSIGDMVARLNDSRRIQRVVVHLSSKIIIDILIVLVSASYIFFYSVSTGFLSLFSIPVFGFLTWRFNSKIIESQRGVMQSYAASESKYIDTIKGIKIIKTFNRENLFSKIANSFFEYSMQKIYSLGLLRARLNFWITTGSALLLTSIISWSAFLVLNEQLLLGQMMAIITLIGSLGSSVISIAMSNIQIQEARIAFDRMYEFASAKPEYEFKNKNEIDKTTNLDFQLNELSIKSLNFRFPGKSLLLKNIYFTIKKGEIVTFFGEIGCGKSTLLSILQRFHPFETGNITLNGKDWDKIPIHNWRNKIAVVSQQVQLFNGTVLENICMEEKPNGEKVVQFCKELGFHDFIIEFQQGYTTIINENSTNLSGGQQQLIALARALYSQPQLLLLDEATAAMGRRTEHFVIELLQNIKTKMAIIFVTHRPQLARHTDRVYIIEDKTVSAAGNHKELVNTSQFYKDAFWELAIDQA